jgi:lysophospholipase L1-like esterase
VANYATDYQRARRRCRLESLERREMLSAQPPLITDAAPYSAAFVKGVFLDTLGRSADPGAQAWFTQQLDAGHPTGMVASMSIGSNEFAIDLVKAAYRQYLGRDPEPTALAYWVNALRTNTRDEQLTAALVASDEFYALAGGTDADWIVGAYQAVLGRAASGADLQWATGLLNSGVSREELASDLAYSVEHEQQVVTDQYLHYLHATPSASDLRSGATQLATGQQTAESLAIELTSSNAYYELQTGVPRTIVPVPLSAIPTWAAGYAQVASNAAHTTPDVVFLGDSITAGWQGDGASIWQQEYASFGALNAGIGGDHTQSLLWRIENGDLPRNTPQLAVVMIGINNIFAGDDAPSVADGVAAVVDELHVKLPNTTILLLGILPAQPPMIAFNTTPIISQVNQTISNLANGQSILYDGMGSSFTNPDGTINTALYQPDLVHLNASGYLAWALAMQFELSAVIHPPQTVTIEPGVQMVSSIFVPVPWWP